MTSARYDAVVDFYAAGWSDETDDPARAALLELLGPVEDERVLDVACGHGRISRALARRGAHVVGVDLSAGLLERAAQAQSEEPLDIRYVHADASTVQWLDADPYAAVVCNFGLSDVDDLDGCLAMVVRALRAGGRFVFSILHPCFPGDGARLSGSWPTGRSYHDEGWWTAQGSGSTLRAQVGANHRTLATYLNTLRAYGLVVDQVVEPGAPTGWTQRWPHAARFPLYLVVRCLASAGLPHEYPSG